MFAYYIHHLDPFVFRISENIGPRWYGLAYVLAFGCSFLLLRVLSRRGYCDLPPEKVGDYVTGCALFGVILGGRLGYALFYKPEMLTDPVSILKVWTGGMSSHGGMLGILIFSLFYARRNHLSWTNLGDNLVVTAPIGLFFGRCANFINGELYGRAAHVAWAVQFPKELFDNQAVADRALAACRQINPSLNSTDLIVEAANKDAPIREVLRPILTPRHPSQIYEALGEGVLLFCILWIVRTRLRLPNGILSGLFFICYAVIRIVVENFREPDAPLILGITRGQFFSIFLILIGIGFIIFAKLRPTFPKKLIHAD